MTENEKSTIPSAAVSRRKPKWVWLIPMATAVIAGWLVAAYVDQRGIPIEVTFSEGHGLKHGDMVKYRGIDVGVVDDVILSSDLDQVLVRIRLEAAARGVAREGSLFWIVRPQVGWTEARGLETVIGAKHIEVVPGDGEPRHQFAGREDNPVDTMDVPGGRSVVLVARSAGGIRPGAAIAFRQIPVGTIRGVALSEDRSRVEIEAYIHPDHLDLLSDRTQFWKTSGARVKAGLFSGVEFNVDSLHSLLIGGVSMSVLSREGEAVEDGHRFILHDEPEEKWLDWAPL